MVMRRLLLFVLLIILLLPLAADETAEFPSATVYMQGVIEPQDLVISIFDETGQELGSDNTVISIEFPSTEQWEVTCTLYFKYTAKLASATVGKLTFVPSDLIMDELNQLPVSIELTSENIYSKVENANTFNTTFLAGSQDDVAIGHLTLRITKQSSDVFSSGLYTGSFSINYTEGS